MTPHEYLETHQEQFLGQLKDLIRIPSISTQAHHTADVQRAADWLSADLQRIGFTQIEQIHVPEGRHPLVFAQWLEAGPQAPTVLIYGHYDVQPAALEDGWVTDPFEPVEKDGLLYARGATDSKINVMSQVKAVESLMLSGGGRLPVNVKLLFEGEEESGSETIEAFAAAEPERLKADIGIICDGGIVKPEQPSLVCGLRGIITLEVHVFGPQKDLHSGHYGGSVHNPIQALTEILAQLHDETGAITVPGFYENVRDFSAAERQAWGAIDPIFEEAWEQVAGAPTRWGEPGYTSHERTGIRPTLEINGIVGGYTAEGVKTVLPSKAMAKISCRLVPDQDPQVVLSQVTGHIKALAPESVRVEVPSFEMGAAAVYLDHRTQPMQLAAQAYEKHWGVPAVLEMAGGSVPIAHTIRPLVNDLVIMGFTHKGGRAHGPNENIVIENYFRAIGAAITYLELLEEKSSD
ncbi:MAG: dipeptidase [Ardenticatenaceae bacterium]|nr:dipeptidase [Ardenticatenaceae bacterium]